MPLNNMSTGKDYVFGLYNGNDGTIVDLGAVQDFRATANRHTLKNSPYNDVPSFAFIPDGYSGSFTIVRTSPALESLHLQLTAAFNAGQEIVTGYINETIRERGGSVTRNQFTGVVFFLSETGTVQRDQTIKQTLMFMASDKKVVSQ